MKLRLPLERILWRNESKAEERRYMTMLAKKICSAITIPIVILLLITLSGHESDAAAASSDSDSSSEDGNVVVGTTATTTTPSSLVTSSSSSSSSSCYTSLDEISLKEVKLSIHRRTESKIPWSEIVETAENEQEAEREEAIESHIPTKRRYVLCPNTTFTIGTPVDDDPTQEDAFYVYEGGSIPLLILNPNLEITCGEDGNPYNHCVFEGGEYQVVSSKELMPPSLREITYHVNPANFTMRGVTMRGSTKRSVQMGELGQDYGIMFYQCIFEQQYSGHYVAYIQTIGNNLMDTMITASTTATTSLDTSSATTQGKEDSSGRQRQRRLRKLQPADDTTTPNVANEEPTEESSSSTQEDDSETDPTTTTTATTTPEEEQQQQQTDESTTTTTVESGGTISDGPADIGEPNNDPQEEEEEEEEEDKDATTQQQETTNDPTASPTTTTTLSPTSLPTSSPTATTTEEEEIPMNPLSEKESSETSSSTKNMLQITFQECIFRNNHVHIAVLGSNDAVELLLSNNIFYNNTIYENHNVDEDEKEQSFLEDEEPSNQQVGSVIMLNDPLPSFYMESNCFLYNTYALSPILLEHGMLSKQGFENLELHENVNSNFVYNDKVLMAGKQSSCPNQMLIVAPNTEDLLSMESDSLLQRLYRNAFSCIDIDITSTCTSNIFDKQSMMKDPSTTYDDASDSTFPTTTNNTTSPTRNDLDSNPMDVAIIALGASFVCFGMMCLFWINQRRNQKVQREEYIRRVLDEYTQP